MVCGVGLVSSGLNPEKYFVPKLTSFSGGVVKNDFIISQFNPYYKVVFTFFLKKKIKFTHFSAFSRGVLHIFLHFLKIKFHILPFIVYQQKQKKYCFFEKKIV